MAEGAGSSASSGGIGVSAQLAASEAKCVDLEMKLKDVSRKLQDGEVGLALVLESVSVSDELAMSLLARVCESVSSVCVS